MLSAPVQPIHWNYNNASGVGRKYRVQRPRKVVPRDAEGQSGLPGRPARSACQAGHLARPGRPDRDLTGRQAGIHPLIVINY